MSKPGFFKQAVTGDDNKTLDQSWTIVMFAVFVILPTVIFLLVGLAAADVFINKHDANVGSLGGGIAAVVAAVASFIASAALILRLDRAPATPSTTTSTESTVTTTVAAPPVQPLPLAAAPSADGTVERLAPKIRLEDVDKSVALVAPKKRGK